MIASMATYPTPHFRKTGALLGLFWNSPGLSWLPLGLSWNSSRPLGSSWAALGLSWTSLFEALGTKRQKDSSKVPKTVPKVAQETKRKPKLTPENYFVMYFSESVFRLFSELPFGEFLGRLVSKKTNISLGTLVKNAACPRVARKSEKSKKG